MAAVYTSVRIAATFISENGNIDLCVERVNVYNLVITIITQQLHILLFD